MRPSHVSRPVLSPVFFLGALLPAQEKPYSLEMCDHAVRLSVEGESGIPIQDFIRIGERVTGRTFTFDERGVEGTGIRFEGTIQVEPAGFFGFFQTALYLHGYACVLRGEGDEEIVEVVRMQGPHSPREGPVYVPLADMEMYAARADVTVLTAIPLEHLQVSQATEALRPFVVAGGGLKLGNVGNASSILVQGPGHRVYLVSKVIELIDVPEPGDTTVRVVRLEHSAAEEVGGILKELLASRRPEIGIAFDGQDTLVVSGDRETVEEVLDLVALIDR